MGNVTELPPRSEQDPEELTGQSIEDLAEQGEGVEEEQTTLFGTSDQLTLTVGGRKKPTESLVKIKSRQEKIAGQFVPDDVVELRIRVRVDKVEFQYVRDSDGDVVGVKRVHHLTPLHVERIDGDEAGIGT